MSVQIGIAQLQLGNDEITRIMDAALTDVPRAHGEDAAFDLWGKNGTGLPATAVPVLVHEIFCEIEWFEQIIWFNRTETSDQLWTCTDLDFDIRGSLTGVQASARPGCLEGFGRHAACAISVRRAGSFDESLLELLGGFFSTPAGAPGDIKHLIATACINRVHFRTLLERVELYRERERLEHKEFSRQARSNETEIVQIARELGLNPEPAGTGPIQWYARCPGTGHTLMITTSHDQFGCGYCKVNGGVDELRAFVEKRWPPEEIPQTKEPAVSGENTGGGIDANGFDLSFRPDTYWPEMLDQEQRLARISGQARREIVRESLANGEVAILDPILADEVLGNEDRRGWGAMHPALMGGEYLPKLGAEDVEIARISLASVTSDQVSIRACRASGTICYAVHDEYETEYELAINESEQPLTLGELVEFIDGSRNPEDTQPGGLLASHWEWDLYCGDSGPEEATRFAWINSAWYPELADYYSKVADGWCEAKRKERGDEYEEEDCA